MPEFSDLIEDLVKDIEPEAAFEALALFQEDEVLGLQSVFEKAAKTPKDRRTPQFLRKISNEVDTVVGVFGRRDAWLRESSVYSDSLYVRKACFDTFELVVGKLRDFVAKEERTTTSWNPIAALPMRIAYFRLFNSVVDRHEELDGLDDFNMMLPRLERYFIKLAEYHVACLADPHSTEEQRVGWEEEMALVTDKLNDFIEIGEQLARDPKPISTEPHHPPDAEALEGESTGIPVEKNYNHLMSDGVDLPPNSLHYCNVVERDHEAMTSSIQQLTAALIPGPILDLKGTTWLANLQLGSQKAPSMGHSRKLNCGFLPSDQTKCPQLCVRPGCGHCQFIYAPVLSPPTLTAFSSLQILRWLLDTAKKKPRICQSGGMKSSRQQFRSCSSARALPPWSAIAGQRMGPVGQFGGEGGTIPTPLAEYQGHRGSGMGKKGTLSALIF